MIGLHYGWCIGEHSDEKVRNDVDVRLHTRLHDWDDAWAVKRGGINNDAVKAEGALR